MPSSQMVKRCLEIAGIRFEIECEADLLSHLEPKLSGFFTDESAPYHLLIRRNGPDNDGYIEDEVPSIISHPSQILIKHEGIFSTQFDPKEGRGEIHFRGRPGDLEGTWPPRGPWMGLKTLYATLLLREQLGSMVHAGGVFKGDNAFVFLGHSGAGKSTITGLLENAWGHQSVLNDESIALVFDGDSIVAHSTPFSGLLDRKRFRNHARTNRLFNLVKDSKTELQPFALADRLRLVMECCVLPPGDDFLEKQAFEVALRLANQGNWNSVHFEKNANELSELFQKEIEKT